MDSPINKSALQIISLSKTYGDRKAVDGVSLHLKQGEIVALLGPAAAGKTTLCHLIVGRTRPDAGYVVLNGEPITHLSLYAHLQRRIVYLPAEPSAVGSLSVERNLTAVLQIKEFSPTEVRARVEELLGLMRLETLRQKRARLLSAGERRRLEIARALMVKPDFLLLDEPFTGVSPFEALDLQQIVAQLKDLGIGMLITDQNVRETLQLVDRAYLIRAGRIVADGTSEFLLENAGSRRIYLGDRFSLGYVGGETEANSGKGFSEAHFTLTAPKVIPAATPSELRFWVHQWKYRETVLQCAQESHGLTLPDLSVKSEGPYLLEPGSQLRVHLSVKGIKCIDSTKTILWNGELGTAAFVLDVPAGAEGAHIGHIAVCVNGLQIARMSFVLEIGPTAGAIEEVYSTTVCHRQAFASYASEDRAEVLARVQGMEAAYKGLTVFVDIVSLRSGDLWEQELHERIQSADMFYLFWCRHSKASKWVETEWQCALAAKGIDFIDPIPLEDPKFASPPAELAAKHFNDPFISFIESAGGVSQSHTQE